MNKKIGAICFLFLILYVGINLFYRGFAIRSVNETTQNLLQSVKAISEDDIITITDDKRFNSFNVTSPVILDFINVLQSLVVIKLNHPFGERELLFVTTSTLPFTRLQLQISKQNGKPFAYLSVLQNETKKPVTGFFSSEELQNWAKKNNLFDE